MGPLTGVPSMREMLDMPFDAFADHARGAPPPGTPVPRPTRESASETRARRPFFARELSPPPSSSAVRKIRAYPTTPSSTSTDAPSREGASRRWRRRDCAGLPPPDCSRMRCVPSRENVSDRENPPCGYRARVPAWCSRSAPSCDGWTNTGRVRCVASSSRGRAEANSSAAFARHSSTRRRLPRKPPATAPGTRVRGMEVDVVAGWYGRSRDGRVRDRVDAGLVPRRFGE